MYIDVIQLHKPYEPKQLTNHTNTIKVEVMTKGKRVL